MQERIIYINTLLAERRNIINMFSLLLIVACSICISQAAILQCDFESSCNDFLTDSNWGVTDGVHPHPIDHDHTLNASTGHYLFYVPPTTVFGQIAEIKTKAWLQPSPNRTICLRLWYYTPRINLPFTVQVAQGDDEKLTRVIAAISGKDPGINDWTLVNVTLPNEKLRLYVRLNVSAGPLAMDDLSVDYCDGSTPVPPKTLLQCDFESSCSNDFVSLPSYPYGWSTFEAADATKIERQAPPNDYTWGNRSGHYSLLPNSNITRAGNVGYLSVSKTLNITAEESFCLSFQYYGYGRSYMGNLQVFTQELDGMKGVRRLWPSRASGEYV